MRGYLLRAILLVLLPFSVSAQNENNQWHFGEYASLDFSSGSPVATTGSSLFTYDMTASVSDNTGSLLFYSNSVTVWNRNHVPMPNGTGLLGHTSGGTSCVAVKKPGSNDLYYLFTVDAFAGSNGLRYSIIDMSLQSGFGDVTVKNQLLLSPATEKIAVVKHCNGQDYWIVCHQWNSNAFNAYLLTSSGLSSTPVVTNIGSNHTGGTLGTYNSIGQINFTEDGRKAVVAIYDLNLFEVLNFNNSTGVFSNNYTITNYPHAWGAEFSPDGNVLYTTQWNYSQVYQFDLQAGSAAAIQSSATLVGNATGPNSSYKAGYLDLGPDGKIYIAKFESYYLASVNNPNQLGSACGFIDNGVSLGTHRSYAGLPNRFIVHSVNPPSLTAANICEGDSTTFVLSGSPADSIHWNFGDPASGVLNTGTVPGHVFSGAGTFTVQAVIYYPCYSDTVSQSLTINAAPTANINGVFSLCSGQSTILTASGGSSYQWSGGSNASTQSISVNPVATTTYYVTAANGACISQPDTFTVQVTQAPVANISGVTTICSGQSTTLTAFSNSNVSYQWSGGASGTTQSITVSPTTTTTYYVIVNDGSCPGQPVSATVQVTPVPVVNVTGSTQVCSGDSTTLTATGSTNYQWSGGSTATTASITVSPAGPTTYFVTGSNGNCAGSPAQVTVTVAPSPNAFIGGPGTICHGTNTTLTGSGGGSYAWSTGATTSSITFISTATSTYSLVVTNSSGCSDTAYFTQVVQPPPFVNAGSDLTICQGDSIQLNGAFTGAQFYWTANSSLSNTIDLNTWVDPTVTTIYILNAYSFSDCFATDSVTVTVNPCTGITEHNELEALVIYPNPVGEQFEIQLNGYRSQVQVRLFDAQGREVYSATSDPAEKAIVNVANIARGLYLLKVSDGETQRIARVIVQ
jgi:hypothetical protein